MPRLEVSSDHWYTPTSIILLAQQFFGRPFYDPTTSEATVDRYPESLRHHVFYNPEEDFLARDFLPLPDVWMNPPYSKDVGGAGAFTEHLLRLGPERALVLVNASTSTRWWQNLAKNSAAILFVAPRIRFDRPDGARGESPRYSNSLHLICLTEESEALRVQFQQHFQHLGVIR